MCVCVQAPDRAFGRHSWDLLWWRMEQLDPENLPGSCSSQGLCSSNWSPRSNNDFQNSFLQHQSCDVGQGKVLLFSEPQFSHLQNGNRITFKGCFGDLVQNCMLGLHHGVSLIKGPEQVLAVPIIIGKGTMLVGERSAEASCTSRRAPEQRFALKSLLWN